MEVIGELLEDIPAAKGPVVLLMQPQKFPAKLGSGGLMEGPTEDPQSQFLSRSWWDRRVTSEERLKEFRLFTLEKERMMITSSGR